jgi:hypothetical protein
MEWSLALGKRPHDILGSYLTEPHIDLALQSPASQPTGHDDDGHVQNYQGHGYHEDERRGDGRNFSKRSR